MNLLTCPQTYANLLRGRHKYVTCQGPIHRAISDLKEIRTGQGVALNPKHWAHN